MLHANLGVMQAPARSGFGDDLTVTNDLKTIIR